MMPSRGLHVVRGHAASLIRLQCRNFSHAPRALSRNAPPGASSIARTIQPWRRANPIAIPSIAAIRHASTAQSPAPATAANPSETASFPNLDTITLDDVDLAGKSADGVDISSIPEGIGYLKQIGLDYGMGPSSMIEWVLEHLHIWGGLPWWASIAATAVVVRIAMFPLYLRASDMMARQAALSSVMKPITERMSQAQKAGNTAEVMQCFQQQGAIRKRAGISNIQQLMPVVAQGIIGFCGFKIMRAAAVLPVPGFTDGGFLWLQDLTLSDPYLLMPIIMGGTIHMIVRMGGETGQASGQMPEGLKKFMLWGMPLMITLITAWQPGAVAIWFAASGAIGIVQGKTLQQPAVRKFFGLAPMYTPKPEERSDMLSALMSRTRTDLDKTLGQPPASAGAKAGRNASYMRPMYQSPNIKRQASPRTIDTTLVASNRSGTSATAAEMIQPGQPAAPKKGIVDSIKERWNDSVVATIKRIGQQTPEQKKEAERKAFKKRAQAYEERARKRDGR